MRAVAAALLLLAGCAGPVQWDKEGATPAALDQDSKECSQKARVSAAAGLGPPPLPQPGMISAPMRQEGQYSMREAQEFETCMLAKGYKEKR